MKWAVAVAVGAVGLLAILEVVVRVAWGLGNPPLWRSDPRIEYLPLPSRSYRRFGRRVAYNAFSMRARDFPPKRTDPRELRVLVVGDSIVHGGAITDQDDLATSRLERRLAESLDAPVVVGNASAGSWGPPNQLAYLERFGLLDADVLVLVLNSRDAQDAPQFKPLRSHMPQRRPLLGLQELGGKYLRRWIRKRVAARQGAPETSPEDVRLCLEALREIIRRARASDVAVLLAQHLKRVELETGPEEGWHQIGDVAKEMDVERVQLGPAFARALEKGKNPYRDGYHPNELGQRLIADRLFTPVLEAGRRGLAARSGAEAAPELERRGPAERTEPVPGRPEADKD